MGKGDTHIKKHTKAKIFNNELQIANKSEGEFYAKVLSVLNGNRIKVKDMKGNEHQASVRGSFFYKDKKENLNFTDADRNEYWVLVQPGLSKNQYFLKHIYSNDDCKKLQDRGELSVIINQLNTIEIGNNPTEEVVNSNDENWIDNI
jgi:hypothetical protein